jgi:endoribonuclease Dicer
VVCNCRCDCCWCSCFFCGEMAGGGAGDAGGGEHASAAYWYDACEDGASLLCGIDFAASADFDPGLIPAMDCGADDGFVAEIDRILESINAETTPAPPPPPPPAHALAPAPAPVAPPQPQPQLQEAFAAVAHNAVAVVDAAQRTHGVEARKEPRRESPVAAANGGGECRDGKRQRLTAAGTGGPRQDWRRRPPPPPPSRGWEDRRGRREHERPRKRDRDGHHTHDHHRREARGFWERDRGGKMVFRHGMWEAEVDRQGKRARTQDGSPAESKVEVDQTVASQKEKPVTEEQARQYQLEVLEQAKSRNTIAFLETGAGKTLIAVLLIKSICDKMRKENKKMLAVFLVPKVPLVYQVLLKSEPLEVFITSFLDAIIIYWSNCSKLK